MSEITNFIASILVYAGGSTVVAYTAFKWLGEKWIEDKFSTRLELLKHQQALEVQRLRIEIDSLLSGTLKIQEHEFLILPEVWEKLSEAYSLVCWLVSPMQEYANLSEMSAAQLEEYLEGSDLRDTEKHEIRKSDAKSETFQKIIFWHRLHAVKNGIFKLQNCIAKNGIFFPAELATRLETLTEHLWSAVTSKEIGREAQDKSMELDSWKEMQQQTKAIYDDTKAYIQRRLLSHARSS
ncbi:hypothetical protein ACQKPT_20280 [Pseudomonas monteilii]|uniref:hypothetical protein n=1 Tax=Pseudomonas monteilii TaxID=76759 RepID=UPI003D08C4A5